MRHLYRLLLGTATALACAFAPVPPPKTGVAEAVLNAFGGGPDQVRHTLEAMLPATLQGEKVRGLVCLKGEKSPAEWVRKRLRVEEVAPKGPVRVRLEGGRPSEALALLTALVSAYEASRANRQGDDDRVVLWQVQRVQQARAMRLVLVQAQGGNAGVVFFEQASERRDGPAVLQRPKLLSTGTSR
jgi:hypothetical protein